MMTEQGTRSVRYLTVRDYLRVLRQYRVAILLLAALGLGLGYLNAKRHTTVYAAAAQISFRDPAQDLNAVGFGTNSSTTIAELANSQAETATRPDVIATARRILGRNAPPAQVLRGSTYAQVSPNSSLLEVAVRATTPTYAAALTNAMARAIVARNNADVRAHFGAAAASIRNKIVQLQRPLPSGPAGAAAVADASQLPFYENELARLETLAQFATEAQIAQAARPPTAPLPSNTVRNTLLGGGIGLLLGIFFAFFRDALDRRLRGQADIESHYDFPVLGHVRNEAMGYALAANGSKRAEPDLEPFRIVRQNLGFLDSSSPLRTILVTSALPEEGKTTVASLLAFAMASAGKRTLLVDCDLRRPALATRLGIEPAPGISDFLAGRASPQEILRTVTFADAPSANGSAPEANGASAGAAQLDSPPEAMQHTVVVIPAGSQTARPAELLASERFRSFLRSVSGAYDAVVLDSAPMLPVADTLGVIPAVDRAIVCARDYKTTRDTADAVTNALARFPELPTGVVVTGIRRHSKDYAVYYGSATRAG